jgi:acetyl esterase/lipase
MTLPKLVVSRLCWSLLGSLPVTGLPAQDAPPPEVVPKVQLENFRVERAIVYAVAEGVPVHLNLFVPRTGEGPFPLIIWFHGGGWRNGGYGSCPPLQWGRTDYAYASVEYRLTGVAKFPAQIIDSKAAVRWLRANAARYRIDGSRIGVWGGSAGGHLAALLGTSGGARRFDVGDHLDTSSAVQAVCDFYGPTDLLSWGKTTGFEPTILKELLGGLILDMPEAVVAASPLSYVGPGMPPFLIVHGDQDRAVPPAQGELLRDALLRVKGEAELRIIPGAAHGGEKFRTKEVDGLVQAFFDRHLQKP